MRGLFSLSRSFFRRFSRRNRRLYEAQKRTLASGGAAGRAALAADAKTHPEILYFLARDGDADIRRAVAVNRSTPVQASALLAADRSADVRLALAARLVELLPGLSVDRHGQLYAYVVQALGALAQDEVLRIRKALSSALKDHADAPPKVAATLARDVEREVSEPILRFCAALPDDDLLDILSGHPEPWVVSAVASRPEVSRDVSAAIVETEDVPGTTILVSNPGADMSPPVLQMIIDRARDYPEWHAQIAARWELSVELAGRLAGFVDSSVLSLLARRADFDAATRAQVADIVRRRLAYAGAPDETPARRLERYAREGCLTAEVVRDALVWQDEEFVVLALASLARIHPVIAEKMLRAGAARPVIALCHRAGMPMRLAVELQREFTKLRPSEVIYARGGTDYPLAPEEIRWQLEFFGVEGDG